MVFEYFTKIGKFIREEYVFCLTLIGIGFGAGRVYDHFTINKPLTELCERQRRMMGQLRECVELSNLVIEKQLVKEKILEGLDKEEMKRRKDMEYMDGLLKELEEN